MEAKRMVSRHVWAQKGLFFDAGSGSFDSVPHSLASVGSLARTCTCMYAYFIAPRLYSYF